ncbi:hypothetical protein [Vibrio scophthalmi]|uniref:Initiator Rep protein domain-containing protein n=1 Tax=Vibrio scophthalmi TaxID=45658 RepID=A0A1E3WRM1_9VIBR|nr:hypothetical protein [Vibrio scophthalmi]ODS12411.1 hypothetical protein VSF3289_02715 [Vibrio scophthalmi]
MIKKDTFVKLNSDCFKNANKKQAELYFNLNVFELKMVLVMLAHANKINTINKNKELSVKFKIELDNMRKKESLLNVFKLSKKEFAEKISEIRHPYFEQIIVSQTGENNIVIEFVLKRSYVLEMNTAKTGFVKLEGIMSYKSISKIKMHIQLSYFSNYRMPFNFAINFLDISKKQARKDQIRSIKSIFKGLKIENDCEYIFPKPREPKDNLHYNFLIKTKKSHTDDVYF